MITSSLILKGFKPDPSIIRVEDTFYIASSTFEWFPGVMIHESRDLVNWSFTDYVLKDEKSLPMKGILNGGGVWAPCLTYHDGTFYMVFSITHTFDEFTQDTTNYIVTAKDIHGPWSEPVRINSGGFDASLFHDGDRKYFLNMIWYERPDHNHFHGIEMMEIDPLTLRPLTKRKIIFKGTERGLVEGPHLYRFGDYYYLLTAEGGTSTEHCCTIARCRDIWGPYEAYEGPILTSLGYPDLPIQYAGHGDIVDDGLGNYYLVHLGSRKNGCGGFSIFGRETFIQNITFREGWPVLTEGGNTPKETFSVPDELIKRGVMRPQAEGTQSPAADSGCTFRRRYDFNLNSQNPINDIYPDLITRRSPLGDRASLDARPGYLRLFGAESLSSEFDTTLLAVRIQECDFTAGTRLNYHPEDVRQRAGLVFMYHSADYYYLFIGYDDEKKQRYISLYKRESRKTKEMTEPLYLPDEGEVMLMGRYTLDGIDFSYGYGGQSYSLGVDKRDCPVTIMSDEYANVCGEQGFTGSVVGICTQDLTGDRMPADFAYFEIV